MRALATPTPMLMRKPYRMSELVAAMFKQDAAA